MLVDKLSKPHQSDADMVLVPMGERQVPVVKDGFYHKYRTKTPLEVVEKIPGIGDLSWFKTKKQTLANVGFTSYTPNFYYDGSMINAIFTADIRQLKKMITINEIVPVSIFPGRGLISFTAYNYRLCDNDAYNEFSIAIATTRPNAKNWGIFTLIKNNLRHENWGYVVQLPVNSELARARGEEIYNLPKWVTEVPFSKDDSHVNACFHALSSGQPEVVLEGKNFSAIAGPGEEFSNHTINRSRDGRMMHTYSEINPILLKASSKADAATITLGEGPVAERLRSLDIGDLVKYQHIPTFQMALHAPKPL